MFNYKTIITADVRLYFSYGPWPSAPHKPSGSFNNSSSNKISFSTSCFFVCKQNAVFCTSFSIE